MSHPITKDPLQPLSFAVRTALALIVALTLTILSINFFGGHAVLGAWGDPHPCVTVPQIGLMISDNSSGVVNLQPGVKVGVPRAFSLCQTHMSASTGSFFSIPVLVRMLWVVGFLLLAIYQTQTARKHGLFTSSVAKITTQLGWYLVGGSLVCTLIHAVCFAEGTSRLVTGYGMTSGVMGNIDVNWAAIIGGIAAISVGRVMRQTVPMREEIEATV